MLVCPPTEVEIKRSAIAAVLNSIGFPDLAPHEVTLCPGGFSFYCGREDIRWFVGRKLARVFGTRHVDFHRDQEVWSDTRGSHVLPGFTLKNVTRWTLT